MFKPKTSLLIAFIAYAVVLKILPFGLSAWGMDLKDFSAYPWSFTPIFAMGLFGVAMFKDIKIGFLLPVISWFIADVLIGTLMVMQYGWTEGMKYAIYPGQPLNYLALALLCGCGYLIRQQRNWFTVLAGGVAGATLFYAVSNFGAWYFDIGEHYPRTLAGLTTCYVAGLPFLKQHMLSTLLYSGIFFSPLGISYLTSQSNESEQSVLAHSPVIAE